MAESDQAGSYESFVTALFQTMKGIDPAVDELELYEFRYALDNLQPKLGWGGVELSEPAHIERLILDSAFYRSIETQKKVGGKVIVDAHILELTQMLFAGLVAGSYAVEWVRKYFYFDVRGFLFFPRIQYFTPETVAHFGGKPYRQFEARQQRFARFQGVGYADFKAANAEVDQAFIETILRLVEVRGIPILMTLAGPTAAGKTEIMERLFKAFAADGRRITTIEMDNFLMDREIRGEQPMGDGTHHIQLFKRSLGEILQGKPILTPRYDFVNATSSHFADGTLKPDGRPLEVEPADIIFIEGNFPFQMKALEDLIGVRVVYLTDDPIRLKRKWKRDIDYRKKYDPNFFINRFFKTQFLRACECYLEQMKGCDIVVDTTAADLWVTPRFVNLLKSNG